MKIRIGLLGCSAIASRSVLPGIKSSKSCDLVTVGSRSLDKARRFGEQYGCKYGTYEDVLSDPTIDAIYISVPVGLHAEWGRQVLDAGKHLLLEKTFTASLDTAKELIEYAMARRLVAMEALPYVYHPLFKKVYEIVSSGILGDLRLVEAHFGFPYLPERDIRNKAELGGGGILDALVYPLSFCLYIGTPNYTTYSFKAIYDHERGIDTRGFVQIEWPDYAAHIAYGFGFMYRNTYTILGEKAYLFADRVFSRPKDFTNDIRIVYQGTEDVIRIEPADHFVLMLDAFARKIMGTDDSGLNEGEDILRRMKIITVLREACYPAQSRK